MHLRNELTTVKIQERIKIKDDILTVLGRRIEMCGQMQVGVGVFRGGL
jgi:hypothetical protein